MAAAEKDPAMEAYYRLSSARPNPYHLSMNAYWDEETQKANTELFLKDLQTARTLPKNLRLEILERLGFFLSDNWSSKNDGKPEANIDRAFYFLASGKPSEDSNCVTAHAVLSFQAAKHLGFEPVALGGHWITQGGKGGSHAYLLIHDPETKEFTVINYDTQKTLAIPKQLPQNVRISEAARLAQVSLGGTLNVQLGSQSAHLTKMGDILSHKVIGESAPSEIRKETLPDGSSFFTYRQGAWSIAQIQTPDEGTMDWVGNQQQIGKLRIAAGITHQTLDQDHEHSSVVVQMCLQSSRTSNPLFKVEGFAKAILEIVQPNSPGSSAVSQPYTAIGGKVQHKPTGVQVSGLVQTLPTFEDSTQIKTPFRLAASAPVARGVRAGVVHGSAGLTTTEGPSTSYVASARAEKSRGRTGVTAEAQFLDRGQGTRAGGTGFALGLNYQLREGESAGIRALSAQGAWGDPLDLEAYLRPEYRVPGSGPRLELRWGRKW
jgi:hypothetical protein